MPNITLPVHMGGSSKERPIFHSVMTAIAETAETATPPIKRSLEYTAKLPLTMANGLLNWGMQWYVNRHIRSYGEPYIISPNGRITEFRQMPLRKQVDYIQQSK